MALILAIPMVVLGAAGGDLTPLLEFDRGRILAGEWWRAISAHFVHLDSVHLAGNVAALLAWGYLFDEREDVRSVLLRFMTYAVAIGAGVLVFNERIQWMLGASGLIHALIAGSALRWALGGRRLLGAAVLAVLVLKVFAERQLGLGSWMESIAEYPIVSVAHVYGIAAGLIFELARGVWLSGRSAFTRWRRWRAQ